MFFDPIYFLFLAPGMLLALWAQWRVKSAYAKASQIRPRSGLSGAEAAAAVLESAGIPVSNYTGGQGVGIEATHGFLSDHYDPRAKVLRLSPDVYGGQSLAALGIAAHEAGHAIQDATRYPLLGLRNLLVPIAGFGSNVSWLLILLGFVLASFHLVLAGIIAFSTTVVFQLVNLPVEFDASSRAKAMLIDRGLISPDEAPVVKKVLSAAALTYVAATLTAVLTLLYFLFRAGLFGGRSSDE
jgi:Zn-dependent membrane protease YugP